MVLITGIINNPDGSPYVGSVEFVLNDLGIDTDTVYLPTVVNVDSDGTVAVDLWPNTNSVTPTYYKCSLDNGSRFNISIPGDNPSYNLGDVILIDPGALEPGILQRLDYIEDSVGSGLATRVDSLEDYTGIADNRIPGIAISGSYPDTTSGTALKVSKTLTLGDGLSGGTYRGDNDVTVAVDGTVIRATDGRLSDAREWSAPLVPIAIAQAGTDEDRYAWSALRVRQAVESWVNTNGITTVNNKTGPNVTLTKADIGLGNVPNLDTTDANNITSGKISPARLSFGSASGLVTEGNDARLSDAREWVAQTAPIEVVSQPSNNTRYAWTPQRIWETIVSWFSNLDSDDLPEGSSNLYYTDSRVSNNSDVQANTDKVSASGSVTTHNDVTSAGSGQIITTPERDKLSGIQDNAQVNTVSSVAGKTGVVVLDSNDVGLGNVPDIDTTNASNITSGTLSGSRLSYGTVANTPAQGNDSRLSNSREWSASTVSQAVAQAGTDTTRYAWTSQRVRDNVAFYTQPFTLAEKSKLAGLDSANYLPVGGTAVNTQLLDNLDSSQFIRSDTDDTLTGNLTVSGVILADEIRDRTGGPLVLNAGESEGKVNDQTWERIYLNAELGLSINTPSVPNWGTGYGVDTALITGNSIDLSGNVVWHEGNLIPSFAALGDTVVQRNGSGYVRATYLHTTPDTVTSGVTQVCVETGNDGFIRHGTSDAILGFIGATSSSTPNTPVMRDGPGDISARLFRSEYDTTNSNIGFIMTQTDTASNNYLRPSTPAQLRSAVTDGYYLGITSQAADSDLWDGWQRDTYLNQSVRDDSVPTFNGLHVYDPSNLPPTGNIQLGRSASQYITFHGGSSGNMMTSVSSATNGKPLYISINKGTEYTNYVFDDDTFTIPGDLYLQDNAIISDNADPANIDHIWHDDTLNAWNFCSDTSYKSVGNSSIQAGRLNIFRGTTRMGDIDTEDTTWLRINQHTAKDIYTPRLIRADGGFKVNSKSVVSADGNTLYEDNTPLSTKYIRKDIEDTINVHTRWADSKEVRLGSGADGRISHNGANFYVQNYTGHTYYKNYSHGGLHYFQSEGADGVNKALCYMSPDDFGVRLYYMGGERLKTTANGINVSGDGHVNCTYLLGDFIRLENPSNAYIDLSNSSGVRTARFIVSDGSTSNYDGQLKIESGSINLYSAGSGDNSIVYFQGNLATKKFGLNTYSNNSLYIQQYNETDQAFEGNIIRFSTTEVRHYVPLVNGSSRHIKDIKGTIPDGLDLVTRLNPVVYNYKGQDNTEVGLIAEEVPPESHLVYGSGPDMAIDYTKLPIYMIDAIKQLTKRIEVLEENAKNSNG